MMPVPKKIKIDGHTYVREAKKKKTASKKKVTPKKKSTKTGKSTALKKIHARAKAIRKKHPKMKYSTAISQASKELKKT